MKKEIRRRRSLSTIHKEENFGEKSYRTQFMGLKHKLELKSDKLWSLMESYLPRDSLTIQKGIMSHVEYTLARTRFDLDDQTLYKGTSLSLRDRLVENWNDSQASSKVTNPKRLYYLSIEFLLGRLLQNALINLDLEDKYKEALNELGFKLEEIYEEEYDPALGNGGLGRLAACYLDSLTTMNYPGMGYGIRYDYGIFRQAIENFEQKEYPDYWLLKGNPWEIQRLDVKYKVPFYGFCRDDYIHGKNRRSWEGYKEVIAIAYDTVIPGWNTSNSNTLRLWKSFAGEEFNFEAFNRGDFQNSSSTREDAGYITSVLYPNDTNLAGRELRLKQQFFFCCATIQDIIRRFLNYNDPWSEFPNKVAIQLNDTHPAIAIPELLRQLVDLYYLDFYEAMDIVIKSFSYTCHTVLSDALEKWSVELFEYLLPRHLELIYEINHFFLEKVKINGFKDKLTSLSIVEESKPKMIRMANLSIIGSHKVNGVAEVHSMLLKAKLFKEFHDIYPEKFTNVTNGVTPRRWIVAAFPELANLLTEYSGEEKDWLSDMTLLRDMPHYLKENNQIDEFVKRFADSKIDAKRRLVTLVKNKLNISLDQTFLFDVQVKRIHEYKRQLLNIFHWVYRYMTIISASKEDLEKMTKRVCIMGGKALPNYLVGKGIIELASKVANTINCNSLVNQYLKAVFIPNYSVSLAQVIIPAADLSQHISTAGTEASGTSNMKFVMTGSLIIGTRDGANIEIAEEIGEENLFFFGKKVDEVEKIRSKSEQIFCPKILADIINFILAGHFGNVDSMKEYLNGIIHGKDFYLISADFEDYLNTQKRVDLEYQNLNKWYKKALLSISRMDHFSSDRCIEEYARNIWNLKKVTPEARVKDSSSKRISFVNLKEI